MNKIIYLLLVMIFISCKANTLAQEKNKPITNSQRVQKPKFSEIDSVQMDPNTITLKGTIVGDLSSNEICGKEYNKTINIRISQVIGSGSGIINMLLKGQQITFPIHTSVSRNAGKTIDMIKRDARVSFVVKEEICKGQGFSKTMYEIIKLTFTN